jgi:hypothetical protein
MRKNIARQLLQRFETVAEARFASVGGGGTGHGAVAKGKSRYHSSSAQAVRPGVPARRCPQLPPRKASLPLMTPPEDEEEVGPPSKTQRKRAMEELQDLGEELVELAPDRLKKVDLPEDLRAACARHSA